MGRHSGTMNPKNIAREMTQQMIYERWSKVNPGTEVATLTPAKPSLEMTIGERCDACGAKAYYKVEFGTYDESVYGGIRVTELFFCGHHSNKYEGKLNSLVTNIGVTDERWAIANRD